jgi:alkylation response protein AidB-like acyl-CoA dehydrogenase
LLDRECDATRVRAIAYEGHGRDAHLWHSLADAGWTGIAVPEEFGGAGLRYEDVCIVLEEAGRAALPLPLTTTLVAARAIALSSDWEQRQTVLRRVATGEASITIALRETERDQHSTASPEDGGWSFSGTFSLVSNGPLCDYVVMEAGRGLVMLPADAPGLRWTDLSTVDRTVRQYKLLATSVRVDATDSLYANADATDAIDALRAEYTVALAAESLGAAERMLEMSVGYAKERVQFGRPIGTNQAVKIRLADMGAALERMRAAVYHAAVKVDAVAEDRDLAVAMAKIATAGQGAWLGSQAIHVHGGVGYTWEHDLHLYFKRIKSNELLLGDDSAHLARVADAVL